MSDAPNFTPDEPVDDIQRLVRRTECLDYKEFSDLFHSRVEDYNVTPLPAECKIPWQHFVDLIKYLEADIQKEWRPKQVDKFDQGSLHKALLQGPKRVTNGIELPFGSPGIATGDIHVLMFRYGFANPPKAKGFHSSHAMLPVRYRNAVETLNGQPKFFLQIDNKEVRATMLAMRLTRHIRLTAIYALSDTDEAKYESLDKQALLATSCPQAIPPNVWACFIGLLRTITTEVSAYEYLESSDKFVRACKRLYIALTEPFTWKDDASVGPRLPKWPIGGPDISAPELWQIMEHFYLRDHFTLSKLGSSQTPVVDAANAYLKALIQDVGGRQDFAESEFATMQLSESVDKHRTDADKFKPSSHVTLRPRPTPQTGSWRFKPPSTQGTYENPAIFPRVGPGRGAKGGGVMIERGESSGTKRTRKGDSPGDEQGRRGRGRGS